MIVQAWTELDNQNTHTIIQNLRLADLLGIARCYEVVIPQAIDSIEKLNKQGWKALIQYLTQLGLRVVLTGGNSQIEKVYLREALLNLPNTVINLAGQLRFSDVAQLICASSIYIGPDTAVTHLAAATGTTTVALYGPTNPRKWAPWPFNYAINQTPFQQKGIQKVGNVLLIPGKGICVPCHKEGCEGHKKSDSRCLEELEGASVIEVIKKFCNYSALCVRNTIS